MMIKIMSNSHPVINALPSTNPTRAFVVNRTSHISSGVVFDTVAVKNKTGITVT